MAMTKCSGGAAEISTSATAIRLRVPDVVNQQVEKFTIDALVSMLARIGKHVRLAVR
jgi:predicted XRE-type DNA-binding protein